MLAIIRFVICFSLLFLVVVSNSFRNRREIFRSSIALQRLWPRVRKYVQPQPMAHTYCIAHRSREALEAAGLLKPMDDFTPMYSDKPAHNVNSNNNATAENHTQVQSKAYEEEKTEAQDPIPLFDEWTKKKLEERQNASGDKQIEESVISSDNKPAVVKQQVVNNPLIPQLAMPTQRNYASKDCGAKVLLTNPNAQNGNAVVKEKERDEYLLYSCDTPDKFLVLELCELMKPTQIQMANFELFSSSTKDFRIFSSTRYPTTEWIFLGEWTAEDNRLIQTFPVKHASYVKFLKVELVTHHGHEHFCPLSLMRVLGVSMVDELEDEGTDAATQTSTQHPPVQVQHIAEVIEEKKEPNVATNKTDTAKGVTVKGGPAKGGAVKGDTAKGGAAKGVPQNDTTSGGSEDTSGTLLTHARDHVVHAAKTLARVVLGSNLHSSDKNVSLNASNCHMRYPISGWFWLQQYCATCHVKWKGQNHALCHYFVPNLVLHDDVISGYPPVQWSSQVPRHSTNAEGANGVKDTKRDENITTRNKYRKEKPKNSLAKISRKSEVCSWTEVFVNMMGERIKSTRSAPVPPTPIPLPLPDADASAPLPGTTATNKETVLVRLNNRIRTLEQNISLSNQYLSELSRRYRTQMEEMNKQYNRTMKLIEDTAKRLQDNLDTVQGNLEQKNNEIQVLREQQEYSEARRISYEAELWTYMGRLLTGEILFVCVFIWYFTGRVSKGRVQDAVRSALDEERRRNVEIRVNGFIKTGAVRAETNEQINEASQFQPCHPVRKKTLSEGCAETDLLTPNPTPSVSTTDLSSEPETFASLQDFDTPVKHERSPPFQYVKHKKKNKRKCGPSLHSNTHCSQNIYTNGRFGALSH